ncbi:hypothetical protein HY468_01820 [Candidatus Roizmanbacteria bacterium]|nr:hypothetical protein [Candidatus Roizmanbacteria bacterium]
MAKVKLMLDPIGNTLNIWWRKPSKDDYAEESNSSNDVIIYGKDGKPKGVEIIGLLPNELNVSSYLGKAKLTKYLQAPKEFIADLSKAEN